MLNYIKLTKGEIWKTGTPVPSKPRVIEGEAWVTARGCAKDFILSAGMSLPEGAEELLVEPLTPELTIELFNSDEK